MTFPITPIPTTHLDSAADDPSQARADILQAIQSLNTIMAEVNQAYGVALLGSTGKYDGTKFPDSQYTDGQCTITAGSNVISLQSLIRLQRIPKAVLLTLTNMIDGDIVLSTDADGGNLALCIYDETNTEWKYLPMSSWTTVA
jgi:hypothetical protein